MQQSEPSVVFVLHNERREPLRSLKVNVMGRTYPLKDLPVGGEVSVAAWDGRDSSLEVEFTDAGGQTRVLSDEGYYCSGMSGTFLVSRSEKKTLEVRDSPSKTTP